MSRLLYNIDLTSFLSVILISCSISGLPETVSKKMQCHFPAEVLSLVIRAYCLHSSEERFGGAFCDKYPNSSTKLDFIFGDTAVALAG